jgi:hypothetical protein
VISSNSCVFVDLIQLHENWWVLIVEPFFWRKISLIKLVKTNRYFFFSLNCHLEKQFLSRSTVYWHWGARIPFTEKPDNCILEMSEKVFLLDTNLSTTFLLIILETVWAVRRYYEILVVVLCRRYRLKVESLAIFYVIEAISGHQSHPVLLVDCRIEHTLDDASIISSKLEAVGRYTRNFLKSILRRQSFRILIWTYLLTPRFF